MNASANSQPETRIAPVNCIPSELHLGAIPRLLVFNKMDLADREKLENQCDVYNAIAISAIDRRSLDTLINEISARLNPDVAE